MIFADLASRAQTSRRSSGTATRPTFASRVENGYFVASAACVAVSALNRADLPTFGRPTMPQLKPISLPHKDVMTGLGPVIHENHSDCSWMAGSSPAMTLLFRVEGGNIQAAPQTAGPGARREGFRSRSVDDDADQPVGCAAARGLGDGRLEDRRGGGIGYCDADLRAGKTRAHRGAPEALHRQYGDPDRIGPRQGGHLRRRQRRRGRLRRSAALLARSPEAAA